MRIFWPRRLIYDAGKGVKVGSAAAPRRRRSPALIGQSNPNVDQEEKIKADISDTSDPEKKK